MPIPFLRLFVVKASALITGLTLAFWNKIMTFFSGKKLAILGAKATGKTTFYNFLTNGELTGGTGIEKTKSNTFKMKGINFRIKSGKDITGSEDFVNVWTDIIKESDYTFYMIDSERVFKNDLAYLNLIEKQLSLIGEFYENSNRKDVVNIVCVFSDKIADFTNNKTEFEITIKNRLNRILNYVGCIVFVGSLKDESNKQVLIYTILKTMISN